MEVTHLEETTAHVVIGGGKSRAFGIANTAEFVTVLSKALYSNPPLAVAREVMCNAWDAHIKAGREDTPIQVEISPTELTVSDQGPGIPDDLMAEIYCIYGESTKRREANQTGGFGLGSKSPFAISDTFTVVSCHNGVQTTYAVSKGSEETDGLPELRTIVSIPTTKTGVTVRIPLNPESDDASAQDMLGYTLRVAENGEMKAEILADIGHRVESHVIDPDVKNNIGLKQSDVGFSLVSEAPTYSLSARRNGRFFVKYGAVIYPIEHNTAYADVMRNVLELLDASIIWNSIPTMTYPSLIIEADEGKLSVNPSREALSYSSATVQHLREKLEMVNSVLTQPVNNHVQKALDGRFDLLFKDWLEDTPEAITTTDDLMRFVQRMCSKPNYGHTPTAELYFSTLDRIRNGFIAPRIGVQGKQFRNYYNKRIIKYVDGYKVPFWSKLVRIWLKGNMIRGAVARPNIRGDQYSYLFKKLYALYGKDIFKYVQIRKYNYSGFTKKRDYNIMYMENTDSYHPFRVIVTTTLTSLKNYLADYPNRKQADYFNTVVIPRSVKSRTVEDVADCLTSLGYDVVRLYEMEKYFPAPKEPKTKVNTAALNLGAGPKKSLAGYALLSDCLTSNGNLDYDKMGEATRIKDGTHVVYPRKEKYSSYIEGLNGNGYTQLLTETFPKTVLVSSYNVALNAADKHKMSTRAKAEMVELANKLIQDPAVLDEVALYYYFRDSGDTSSNYHTLAKIPEIAQEFGFTLPTLPASDYNYRLIMFAKNQSYGFRLIDLVRDKIPAISMNLPNRDLLAAKEDYLDWLPLRKLDYIDPTLGPNEEQKVLISLVQNILKG